MQEKPLSIAMREIDAGLLVSEPISEEEAAGLTADPVHAAADAGDEI